jgi:hypothetical protein
MSATFFDTEKVLDIEIMSKFCIVCHTNPTSEQKCNKNDEVTSRMDVACVLNILDHSLHNRDICYTSLGDGDSKAYQLVVARKTYGPNVQVTMLKFMSFRDKNGSKIEICERKNMYKIAR